ncbi:MAG: pantetheine-phosphate adenylyltransferase [Clostridia bacterium]|nr:pantetheine-phosphate adenylyltransferase [Clostridia bacterium]
MKTAVYPGSFDPLTNGHLDIITRSSKLFDKVIVTVLKNSAKKPLFSIEERVDFIRRTTKHLPKVEVESFDGLLVEFAKEKKCNVLIKGLRVVSDFEYEFQMALANKNQMPEVETMFLPTAQEYMFLSSSIVKELARYHGDLTNLVPPEIEQDILNKF